MRHWFEGFFQGRNIISQEAQQGKNPTERQHQERRILPHPPKEEILETREIEGRKLLKSDGPVPVYFLDLQEDGSGIFKPESAHDASSPKRERAAYIVSKFFGFDVVPPTVMRVVNGEQGSLQEFIPEAKPGLFITEQERAEAEEQLIKMWLLDFIIWNTDRHDNNVLLKDGRIYAIDNSLTFRTFKTTSHLMRAYAEFYNSEIPLKLKTSLQRFIYATGEQEQLRELLTDLLDSEEIEGVVERLRFLEVFLNQGKISVGAALALFHSDLRFRYNLPTV